MTGTYGGVQPVCSMLLSRTADTQRILIMDDEEERAASMRALGAKNIAPPLPRSSHLLLKRSGHVIPYDPMFAEQRDLVANCDATGNTDPAAWMPTVVEEVVDPVAERSRLAAAQAEVLTQAMSMSTRYRMPDAVDLSPRPMEMPNGAVPIKDLPASDLMADSGSGSQSVVTGAYSAGCESDAATVRDLRSCLDALSQRMG